MIKFLLASLTIILLSILGCSKPSATPIPATATPTPTFEQQRAAVAGYLRALNKIHNDLYQVNSAISWPSTSEYGTAAGLLQLNSGSTQFLTAAQGELKRVDEVKVPELAEARAHFQDFRNMLGQGITAVQKLQAAINAGNPVAIQASFNELAALRGQELAVNRFTETLLLKYNIPDAEVDYRFRGILK